MSADLGQLFAAHDHVARWTAERENASARLELARIGEASAFLLSQHEPVADLNIDRDELRVLLSFIRHQDKNRMKRDLEALPRYKATQP